MSNNPFIPTTAPANSSPIPNSPTSNTNDTFEVDLSGVSDGYTIPDGTYPARCIDVQQTVSKGGNPMFVWDFEVSSGDFQGRTFKLWTAITPAAMWKVAETVIALGVGQAGETVKFSRGDVLNKPCGIVVEADEYNGKPSSRITRVISVSELRETAN